MMVDLQKQREKTPRTMDLGCLIIFIVFGVPAIFTGLVVWTVVHFIVKFW